MHKTDFCMLMSKEVEEHSQQDDFVGTAFYLAPEAIRIPSTIKLFDECKDFILSLLQKPPDKLLSASEALKHAWIIIWPDFETTHCETVVANVGRKHRNTHTNDAESIIQTQKKK
eukprot:779862_1